MHQTYGAINQSHITMEKSKSANPTPQVVQRIQDQKQLKIDLDRESSGAFIISIRLNGSDIC